MAGSKIPNVGARAGEDVDNGKPLRRFVPPATGERIVPVRPRPRPRAQPAMQSQLVSVRPQGGACKVCRRVIERESVAEACVESSDACEDSESRQVRDRRLRGWPTLFLSPF